MTNLSPETAPDPRATKRLTWRRVLSYSVVAAATAFVALVLNPKFLWNSNTIGGGDSGGTMLAAHFMANSLLPHGSVTGWCPWWFLGFPAYVFYFPLPAVVTSLVGYVVGFNVAAHWAMLIPVIALPASLYVFGRLVRIVSPIPELLCVAAVGYLFEPTWSVSGGNLVGLAIGEYSYAWAIPLGLVALGLLWRSLNTGKHRVWTALALAATMLSHVVVGIGVGLLGVVMFIVVATASNVAASERRRRLLVGVAPAIVGAVLTAWWLLPFVFDTPYSNTVGWGKNTVYGILLMPNQLWLLVLALLGMGFGVTRGWRIVRVLSVGMLMFAGLFIYLPQASPIWNERFYPLYVLVVWMLGAVGAGGLAIWSREKLAGHARLARLRVVPMIATSLAATMIVVFCWASSGWAPFGATPAYQTLSTNNVWKHVSTAAGYRTQLYGALAGVETGLYYKTLQKLYTLLEHVGAKYGCGAVENDALPPIFNTQYPWAMLSLRTNGCLSVPDGPFLESSPTHVALAELQPRISFAFSPGGTQDGINPNVPENLTIGVRLMQQLGIRYYMAYTHPTIALAAKQPDLQLIADGGGVWHVYLVKGSAPVEAARIQPIVLTGPGATNANWGLSGAQFIDAPGVSALTLVQSGPAQWKRMPVAAPNPSGPVTVRLPALRAEPLVTITHYRASGGTISFHVSRVGVPIDVKTSYFPNWHVIGAPAIYRSMPNFMIVVPTSKNVTLYYGQTPVDRLGDYATYLGLLGLVGLFILDRRSRRSPWLDEFHPDLHGGPDDEPGSPSEGTSAAKRRFLSFEGTSRRTVARSSAPSELLTELPSEQLTE